VPLLRRLFIRRLSTVIAIGVAVVPLVDQRRVLVVHHSAGALSRARSRRSRVGRWSLVVLVDPAFEGLNTARAAVFAATAIVSR